MEGKKATVVGGGHGTSIVLASLTDSGMELGAVVSMADDGGSTGRLRSELGVSAVGDIRQCLAALSTKPQLAELFSYRFKNGELAGHSLGNLFLAAGELRSGSLEESIKTAKKALGVEAEIFPSTPDKPSLVLQQDSLETTGVYEIANTDFEGKKPLLSLNPTAKLSESACRALAEADYIIIAPGNFYCSIMPALLVDGMVEALNASKAKVLQVCNLVNRAGHTEGFKATDYPAEISRLAGSLKLDALLYNTGEINSDLLRDGEEPVGLASVQTSYKAQGADIVASERAQSASGDAIAAVRSLVRHDKAELKKALLSLIGDL